MRRIGIYVIYDKDSIVDSYIGYMLKELRTVVEALYVVINGKEVKQGKENLSWATEVLYRDNRGYDIGAIQDALINRIGWDIIDQYDELVLANDSFYGPFWHFKDIFDEMDAKSCDFWGASIFAKSKSAGRYIKEHVQSFFMVIRSTLLHTAEYKDYWEALPVFTCFEDAVTSHETVFTDYFAKLGYTYDCMADMKPNNAIKDIAMNYMQYGFLQHELIKKRNFPFLKKKPISIDFLNVQTQEQWRKAINYIEEYTDYDVNMIFENMIRTSNHVDLYEKLQLQYIIAPLKEAKKINKKTAIIVWADFVSASEYLCEYLSDIQGKVDVFVLAANEKLYRIYKEKGYNVLISTQSLSELATEKYDYFCLIHDNDTASEKQYSCTGKSLLYNVWDNLLLNTEYISQVLELFEENKHLGILTHPIPNHAQYFGAFATKWNGQYTDVKKWLEKNNISCHIAKNKMPVVRTNNIWIRSEVLRKAIEYGIEKEPFHNFLWSYLAQSRGFYSGVIEAKEFAEMNQINQQHYLNQIEQMTLKQYGADGTFEEMLIRMSKTAIQSFVSGHKKVYIYGTGYLAMQYKEVVGNICGYIVSDGQPIQNSENTSYLSQIEPDEEVGIVVCLNDENQDQVIPALREKGYHFFCV